MKIISDVKEIANLVQKMGNIDLYRKIVDLESDIVDLTSQKNDLERRVEGLTSALNQSRAMTYRKPFYYTDPDETAYCPKCWESDNKAIHLLGPEQWAGGPKYDCPQCHSVFHHPAEPIKPVHLPRRFRH